MFFSAWRWLLSILTANKYCTAVSGWGFWFFSSWIFDSIMYPLAIAIWGPVYGGLSMAMIAIVISYYWTKGVLSSGKDWFGMDQLHKIQRVVFWAVRATKRIPFVPDSWVDKIEFGLTFLALSIAFDPMICTLYFRRGDASSTLNRKDVKIFVWSAVISNTYWILRSWGLVVILQTGWELVFP